jgi:Periplasmic component of the Tol biopolymer transport system
MKLKFSIKLFVLLFITSSIAVAQQGIFTSSKDIGKPKLAGSVVYNEGTQTYTLKGAGANIWGQKDEHHFCFNKISGDFILTANFKFEGVNEAHRKIGWMVRSEEDGSSVMCGAFVHGDGLTAMQWRERKGAMMQNPEDEFWAPKLFYDVIQLERQGKEFIMRAAQIGEPFQEVGRRSIGFMPDNVLAGLVICSHDENIVETAYAWNVRIDHPAKDKFRPGCRLETMNVFDGVRKVIHEDKSFEAPNWMPDGKKLLINMGGSLYTIPVEGGELQKINTGSATRNNNDHCISFDGKMLGISNDQGGSKVYVLPIGGGEPQLVTEQAPSYLHGWAPNNKEVVYVAQRNKVPVYDIYRKNIKGGPEVKLTENKKNEHVDGCEYSPDGKYIYYNGSVNGGTMQIWRMKPDGSGKEQLTFDEYNNWFPHISPDGKWMAFISFPHDIELNSHPANQRVMLRLMPVSGGAPRVIAWLYGGQGTFNVNSWSPDSKSISFVSNGVL